MRIKWYWSLNKIPEFSQMSASERRKIYWVYLWRVIRRWEHVLVVLAYFILYFLFGPSILFNLVKDIDSPGDQILVMILCSSIFGGVSCFLYSEFMLNLIANQIQRENVLKENMPK